MKNLEEEEENDIKITQPKRNYVRERGCKRSKNKKKEFMLQVNKFKKKKHRKL